MKLKRSTVIPVLLLIYLAVMAYIGRSELLAGHYLYYFGIIGATLVCIVLLHFSLKRRERLRAEREAQMRDEADGGGGEASNHSKP